MKKLLAHISPLALLLPLTCCGAQTQHYETVGLCKVLKDPSTYANRKVSLRGAVYIGVESTNISDHVCPGKTIALKVGDNVYEHADIRSFHRKVSGWKMHGYATVAGTFTTNHSPLSPYVLNVEKVSNVTQKR